MIKKVLMFVTIATVAAAVGLAISGPPRSPQTPVSAPEASASADVVAGVSGATPNRAPIQYLPPSFRYDSEPVNGRSRAALGSRYSSGGFCSGCSGGSCCPK